MADDTWTNHQAIKNMISLCKIENLKINLFSCEDGINAIEQFKIRNQLKSKNNYDLIIMDFNMKIMNGDLAIKKVKNILNRSKNQLKMKTIRIHIQWDTALTMINKFQIVLRKVGQMIFYKNQFILGILKA